MTFLRIMSSRALVAFSSSILRRQFAVKKLDSPFRLVPMRGFDLAVKALGVGERLRIPASQWPFLSLGLRTA